MKTNLQSRIAFCKTILPLSAVRAKVEKMFPQAQFIGAVHPSEGTTPEHCHFVIRFPSVTRWDSFAQWLHSVDNHENVQVGKSWRRCVRYCFHLDNPEKVHVDRSTMLHFGLSDSEIDMLLGSSKLPLLESLILADKIPLSRRFEFLVCERGHSPSEISSALRCLRELEKWDESKTARGLRSSALPDSVADSEDSAESELEDFGLQDEDGNPFYG